MPTSKEYRDLILDKLDLLENISYKSMMGEYLLYYNKILFGGIYDNRLLIKIVETNKDYNLEEAIPYKNAKLMYFIKDIENKKFLKEIIIDTCKSLKSNNKKNKKYLE
ncbi:TfoX/Sxy family protein [uncultured Brachyspira sp.]|uniref:TfoX/Sxy family protein n=1 Tax=uncultured Brachyspira sp. TaxID=221953 RepID=UPI0025926E0F|nr:TfoX/Sxy family protein [uncultured Brachyspira sp.]